jgi:hypothetical protein
VALQPTEKETRMNTVKTKIASLKSKKEELKRLAQKGQLRVKSKLRSGTSTVYIH